MLLCHALGKDAGVSVSAGMTQTGSNYMCTSDAPKALQRLGLFAAMVRLADRT